MSMEKAIKKRRPKKHFSVYEVVVLTILVLWVLTMLFLLYWGLVTTLKTQNEFRRNVFGLPSGAPWAWEWRNFVAIFNAFKVRVSYVRKGQMVAEIVGLGGQVLNSIIYSAVSASLTTLVPLFVAYVTSRFFKFRISKFCYTLVIILIIMPVIGDAVPMLRIVRSLGLYDSIWGIGVMKFHWADFYYLVFFAAFKTIPKDAAEAAYIDGASEITVMFKIYIPLILHTVIAVMLLKFMSSWSDYQYPLLWWPSRPTLAYGLWRLTQSSVNELNTIPMRLAGAMILAVPIGILFATVRRKVMGSLAVGVLIG